MPENIDAAMIKESVNEIVQDVLGEGPDTLVEISHQEADGMQARAYLFTGSDVIRGDGSGTTDFFAMASEAQENSLGLAITSQQRKVSHHNRGVFARAADLVAPAYDAETLVDIYYDDPDYRSAVDTRSTITAGLGFEINPKRGVHEPSQKQKERLEELLNHPSDDMSTSEILTAIDRDMLVVGAGFMEVERKTTGPKEDSLIGFTYAPALVTRISKSAEIYYQIHEKAVTLYRKLGGKYEDEPNALVVHARKTLPEGFCTPIAWLSVDETVQFNNGELKVEFVASKDGRLKSQDTLVNDTGTVVKTNEILQFHRVAANDSYYGVPEIISAIRDYVAARYIREMNNNFFDNNTIPPLLVTVTGENLGEDDVKNIKNAIMRNRGKQAFHKAVYLELPMGAELKIEPLTQFIANEASFLNYLDHTSSSIHKCLRVPRSMTGIVSGAGAAVEEADRRFIESVVMPDQNLIEYRMNLMFKKYAGITDWVINLKVLTLEDAKQQAEIDDIYMRRGARTINDIRLRNGETEIDGGDEPTLIVPGVGVLVVSATKALSDAVLQGKSAREHLMPRGAKTPAKGDPQIRPTGSEDEEEVGQSEASARDVVFATLLQMASERIMRNSGDSNIAGCVLSENTEDI